MEAVLQQIRDLVNGADLSAEVRQHLLWRLDQLPPLYRDLQKTYESRYREGILEHAQGMLKTLAGKMKECPDAPQVMDGIVNQLQDTHARLGIPNLGLKIPVAKSTRRKVG